MPLLRRGARRGVGVARGEAEEGGGRGGGGGGICRGGRRRRRDHSAPEGGNDGGGSHGAGFVRRRWSKARFVKVNSRRGEAPAGAVAPSGEREARALRLV